MTARTGDRLTIHLTAIGGVGMVATAGLLTELGHRVSGSDLEVYPPASDELARLGVPVARGYRAENLSPRPDLVVIGNTIPATNPEAIAARRQGIPTLSMPEALAEFCLTERTPLVIAGTHGKTTSASFLAWVLRTAGREPGYFIGGAPRDLPSGYALGRGREFVLEGDEYDTAYFDKGPKFLHYRPEAVVLTAVEFDHADIYRDLAHVKQSFARLLEILPATAPLLVCGDFPEAIDVVRSSGRAFVTFGEGAACDWRVEELADSPSGLRFSAVGPTERIALESPLLGAMNARNLLGVAALARTLGVDRDAVRAAAASFHGVRRRQEVVARGEATLIDDFAHHPTAIAATLAAVRSRFPAARIWALFDPRSNTTRRRVFQREIARSLAMADRVAIGPVHDVGRIEASERFSPEEAVRDIAAAGRVAFAAREHAELAAAVIADLAPGDVVVTLSNGAFGGIVARLEREAIFAPRAADGGVAQ
jgi:UDP-N-acetylmuramate: L-alanyl-gamma-D-glutamyl-meso-diaminopimelate ligase